MSATRLRPSSARGRKQVNPLVVAAIVIALAALGTYWAFAHSLPFLSHPFKMYAVVRNSVDIIPGSPVRIAGIDVGKVTTTEPDGTFTKVAFTVNSDALPVHTDATATIRDRLFLEGGYYIQLDPGSPSAPDVHSGFTIPVSNTAYPVQFYQVLSTFDLAARRSLENTLTNLNIGFGPPGSEAPTAANSGAGGLKVSIPQLTPTLKDVAWVTQALRGTQAGDVERLLGSAASVATTLASNSAQLTALVIALERSSGALASTDGALGQTISGLDQTLRVAPPALSAVDRALPPLVHLAEVLDPSLRLAPPIVQGVTRAVVKLASVLRPAERAKLIRSLKTTFVSFPTTVHELGILFPITKGVTDCLRTHVTPILKAKVPDGSLSSGAPVWQDFVHLLSGLTNAVQNFDANGYWIRVIGATGNDSLSVTKLGSLLGSGGGTPAYDGARPHWVGDLNSSAFHPDVPCSSQPVPKLSASVSGGGP
jgi:phospholipid/cholesterol/gamma-HCH transport system substrate-binding protein